MHQAENHFQGSGLSRAIGTKKTVNAALRDVQIQMSHPQGAAVLLAQIVGFNDIHGKTSLCRIS